MSQVHILLYYANLVGYARLLLLVACFGFLVDDHPVAFIVCYALNALLDAIDGILARKFNQVSSFGSWLDVVVDNIGRTFLWLSSSHPRVGGIVICIEWLCFVCTHQTGARWKDEFENAPAFVKGVMARGYRQPLGVFTIAGIHVLPIFLYGVEHGVDEKILLGGMSSLTVLGVLAAGRLLGAAVELWVIKRHIHALLAADLTHAAQTAK